MASLAKKLDELVIKHKDARLRAFVNLIGDDQEALETAAKEFAEKNKLENVPVVVPVEFKNGPENFGITEDAEVTVMLYKAIQVKSNFAFSKGDLEEGSDKILEAVPSLLE